MDEVLQQALSPVLRDLEGSGLAPPRIEVDGWWNEPGFPTAMLRGDGGAGTGVHVVPTARTSERIASLADQVQEWAIEELWGQGPTNWPPCPRHPRTHPLKAVVHDDTATWVCPVDERFVAVVGSL